MNPFEFFIPQNITVGAGTLAKLPECAKKLGGSHAMLISGPTLRKMGVVDKVADYLFQTEEWTMYELILFGNLYTFYNVDYVARIGREVMEREDYYKEIGRHRKLVLILALNCYQHCLENRTFTDPMFL